MPSVWFQQPILLFPSSVLQQIKSFFYTVMLKESSYGNSPLASRLMQIKRIHLQALTWGQSLGSSQHWASMIIWYLVLRLRSTLNSLSPSPRLLLFYFAQHGIGGRMTKTAFLPLSVHLVMLTC
jgi:hypothetical protein